MALVAKDRSQLRTVEGARPRSFAIGRWPVPLALAVSAAPITSVLSRRRTKVSSGTSTWVVAQGLQIDRRRRRRSVRSR